jgi:hypothetical protein
MDNIALHSDDLGRPRSEKKTTQIGVRLDEDLIADIDAAIADLKREKGIDATRSQIIKSWLAYARDHFRPKKKK